MLCLLKEKKLCQNVIIVNNLSVTGLDLDRMASGSRSICNLQGVGRGGRL